MKTGWSSIKQHLTTKYHRKFVLITIINGKIAVANHQWQYYYDRTIVDNRQWLTIAGQQLTAAIKVDCHLQFVIINVVMFSCFLS